MFSATMPPRVEALAKKYLRHPVFISVGDRKAASRVEQRGVLARLASSWLLPGLSSLCSFNFRAEC